MNTTGDWDKLSGKDRLYEERRSWRCTPRMAEAMDP
jgi:hypothetical protein